MDVNQYLEIFLDETKEHLESLNTQILSLEQEPENVDTINEIFRAAHSMKGMAGTMGYKRMQALTHDMENVFSEIRNGTMKVNSNLIDTLFQCLDALEEYTENIQQTADEGTNDNQQLINMLNAFLKPGGKAETSAKESGAEAKAEDGPAEKWMDIKIGES
ncbi:MAG: Hpt domain-containing protein, partial [Lachnospiraceae bacterium]|nr:Hpt domain-containing protein [Lachnospiraceae bacterium]